MEHHLLSFSDTRSFSKSFLDYMDGDESLKPFYHRPPSLESFRAQLEEKNKSYPVAHREVLVSTLNDQYKDVETPEAVARNLKLLGESKTFTVTTGHQLNIMTGPLYFIYKIVTVINLSKKLKSTYPDYNFVPVYWMASEDHDFDEINHFRLYGEKYTWTTSQAGAVGRFDPKNLEKLLSELPGDTSLFRDAYLKNDTLADAARHYVNTLFGEEGLIVVDGDSRPLKSLVQSVIKDDLTNHQSKRLVDETNTSLRRLGHKSQIYARDINFFYLDKNVRGRLEKINDGFTVVDTALTFTASEIDKFIDTEPEKFSPNVVMRPLYQEVILPNLAYIGGPAEVVYWLQLKSVFDFYKIPYPIVLPRNFAMVMDGPAYRKFKKTGLELSELFIPPPDLYKHCVLKFTRNKIELNGEKKAIEKYFESIREHVETFDKTLGPLVGAETRRAIKSLEKIEQKLMRAEKRNQSDKLGQIDAVRQALFPGGSPQERKDNFLNFYNRDRDFIKKLISTFDPLDFRFNVLIYND